MKLTLITSSLIALAAAAPAFQAPASNPASLLSPLAVVKRSFNLPSLPHAEEPALKERFVGQQGRGGSRGGRRDEEAVNSVVLEERFVGQQGSGGSRGGRRDEEAVNSVVLEERFVGQQGRGGSRGGRRDEEAVNSVVLEERFVGQQGSGGSRGGRRDESSAVEPAVEARYVQHVKYPDSHATDTDFSAQ